MAIDSNMQLSRIMQELTQLKAESLSSLNNPTQRGALIDETLKTQEGYLDAQMQALVSAKNAQAQITTDQIGLGAKLAGQYPLGTA